MNHKDTGGPAFPVRGVSDGATLRDYFAAKAMAAMLANPNKEGGKCGKAGLMVFPGYAYEWADAMLAERAK